MLQIDSWCEAYDIIKKAFKPGEQPSSAEGFLWWAELNPEESCSIYVPIIEDEDTYMISMHEVGHVADFIDGFGRDIDAFDAVNEREIEKRAWKWAFDNSIIPIPKYWRHYVRYRIVKYYA
jgi:hypothetical protein